MPPKTRAAYAALGFSMEGDQFKLNGLHDLRWALGHISSSGGPKRGVPYPITIKLNGETIATVSYLAPYGGYTFTNLKDGKARDRHRCGRGDGAGHQHAREPRQNGRRRRDHAAHHGPQRLVFDGHRFERKELGC